MILFRQKQNKLLFNFCRGNFAIHFSIIAWYLFELEFGLSIYNNKSNSESLKVRLESSA